MKYLLTSFYIFLTAVNLIFAQKENYTVRKAVVSSDKYDELCPVYYYDGIVFISNRTKNTIVNYSDSDTKGQFRIYYMDTVKTGKWTDSRLFSTKLRSKVNEGPACFSKTKDTIYFTRNILSEGNPKELSSVRNKLGIFTAVTVGKDWSKIKDFRFNDEWYNVSTPFLSPDGKRLYFSSDKPGGYGGSDLYYCDWKGQYWNNPVNLGPGINTKGNESYPFITGSGDMFFTSDGRTGYGGKDIFYSKYSDTTWLEPVLLESPVNSAKDDFGFICDSLMNSGYFSSNRESSYDIFSFVTNFHQPFYCESQRENNYRFSFSQPDNLKYDRTKLSYSWDFGDGTKNPELNTIHDFQGPGKFNIRLSLVDINSGKIFMTRVSYRLDLRETEQPYIRAELTGASSDSIKFGAELSNLPGFKILDYSWDFGDGMKDKGIDVKHIYKDRKADYNVKLNLTVQDLKLNIVKQNCVFLKIPGTDNSNKQSNPLISKAETVSTQPIESSGSAKIDSLISADKDISSEAVFQLEFFRSKTRIDTSNSLFSKIPRKYTKREIYRPEDRSYSYIADEEPDLMMLYPSYQELLRNGYIYSVVRTYLPTDAAEKELNIIKKVYGSNTDNIYEKSDIRLSISGFSTLDQVIALMKKFPRLRLMIVVHSDDTGMQSASVDFTQNRAIQAFNYMVKNGISSDRMMAKGMGSHRPVATNTTEAGRKLNRRIEFIIMK